MTDKLKTVKDIQISFITCNQESPKETATYAIQGDRDTIRAEAIRRAKYYRKISMKPSGYPGMGEIEAVHRIAELKDFFNFTEDDMNEPL